MDVDDGGAAQTIAAPYVAPAQRPSGVLMPIQASRTC